MSAMLLSRSLHRPGAYVVLSIGVQWIWIASLPAATKPWTLDAILDLKTVSDPEISTGGERVAYVVNARDERRNAYSSAIWIVPSGGGPPQHLASPHFSDTHPRWSSDGRQLAFLSRRDATIQIYLVTTPDATPRKLTASDTDITDFKWSADGRYIGYLAADPDPAKEAKRLSGDDPIVAGEGYSPVRLHILSVDGGSTRVLQAGGKHLLSFDWAPDGSKVVYAAQKSPAGRDAFHVDIYESDLASGRETPLVVQPGQDQAPAYSRDGRYVAFYSQRGVLSYFGERQVGVVPSGGGAVRYVTDRLDGDIFAGATKFWWSKEGSRLIFGAGRGTSDYLFSV